MAFTRVFRAIPLAIDRATHGCRQVSVKRLLGSVRIGGALVCVATNLSYAQGVATLASPADAINKKHTRLRAATGHPCLEFRIRVRPEVVIDHTFDHLVEIRNTCTRRVAVRLCYKDSTSCQVTKLRTREMKSVLLGVVRDRPTFSFDFTEAYDD